MKTRIIKTIVVLMLLSTPLMAEKKSNVITIADFDEGFKGFSFSLGKLISLENERERFPIELDFIFDLPNGLGMNNTELDSIFSGEAMIQDLGKISLEKDADIIEDEYVPFLSPEEIITGHTYEIKTAKTGQTGRIQIINVDMERDLLTFRWVLLDM